MRVRIELITLAPLGGSFTSGWLSGHKDGSQPLQELSLYITGTQLRCAVGWLDGRIHPMAILQERLEKYSAKI